MTDNSSTNTGPNAPKGGARIARFELPGRRWYFASCQDCGWLGLDWKHKGMAKGERDKHNEERHGSE